MRLKVLQKITNFEQRDVKILQNMIQFSQQYYMIKINICL